MIQHRAFDAGRCKYRLAMVNVALLAALACGIAPALKQTTGNPRVRLSDPGFANCIHRLDATATDC
jgi:hypothetical protein